MVSEYGVLVESLTPVDAERLVAQIRDLAVDIVRRHGGHVNQAIGEEIVSVFGVVAAHDDDELRAVRAALELHAPGARAGGGGRLDRESADPVWPSRRIRRRPEAAGRAQAICHRWSAEPSGVEAGGARGAGRCRIES